MVDKTPVVFGESGTEKKWREDYLKKRELQILQRIDAAESSGDKMEALSAYRELEAFDVSRPSVSSKEVEAALKGATFNFSDEIQGGLNAIPDWVRAKLSGSSASFLDIYNENVLPIRAVQDQFSQTNPVKSALYELGGGVASGVGLIKAFPNLFSSLNKLPKIVQGVTLGGGFGGLSGAGGAKEGERLKGTAIGTGTGMAVGGVLAPVLPHISNAFGKIVVNPLSRAKDVVLGKPLIPSSGAGATEEKLLIKALSEASMTPKDALAKLNAMNPSVARETVVADLSSGLQRVGQFAASNSLKGQELAKNVLDKRARESLNKITEPALRRLVGTDENAIIVVNQVRESGKALSKPFYDEVDKTLVKIDKGLMNILSRDEARTAYQEAVRRVRSDIDWPAGVKIPNIQKLTEGSTVPLRLLDEIKRVFNDRVGAALSKNKPGLSRNPANLAKSLVSNLDEKYPFYKEARTIYSGSKQFEKSVEMGTRVLRDDATEVMLKLSNMSATDKRGFMIGAHKAIREKLLSAKISGDESNKLSTGIIRERLAAVAPSQKDLDDFISVLDDVSNMFSTRNEVLYGSQTNTRKNIDDLINRFTPSDTNIGAIKAWGVKVANKLIDAYRNPDVSKKEDFATGLANILFTKGKDKITPILESLIKHQDRMTPKQKADLAKALSAGLAETSVSVTQ